MSDQWYYAVGNEQRGPVGIEQIRQMLCAGQMAADNLVWRDGMPDWLPATAIAELQAAPPPPPPATQQPQWAPTPPPPGLEPLGGAQNIPSPLGYAGLDPEVAKLQSQASTAMVVGIIALVVSACVCGPVGLGLGIWAWNLGGKIPPGYPFSGQGKAGMVCGIIGTVLGGLSLIVQGLWVMGIFVGGLH